MKYLLYILILARPILCNAQDVLTLSCNGQASIDTLILKEEILRLSDVKRKSYEAVDKYLTLSDINNVQIVEFIQVYIDTLDYTVRLKPYKSKQLLYFFTHNYWYEIDYVTKTLSPKSFEGASFRLEEIVGRDLECAYYMPSLFSEITTSEQDNLFCFTLKGGHIMYVFGSNGMLFSSLEEYINFNFGSCDNYLEAYIYRMKHKKSNINVLRDFLQAYPKSRSNVRVRGSK